VSLLAFVSPALPLHSAGKYVAGAYIVFVVLILAYVAIMAKRLATNQRELAELREEIANDPRFRDDDDDDHRRPDLPGPRAPMPEREAERVS
jgi:hypothetical protein